MLKAICSNWCDKQRKNQVKEAKEKGLSPPPKKNPKAVPPPPRRRQKSSSDEDPPR